MSPGWVPGRMSPGRGSPHVLDYECTYNLLKGRRLYDLTVPSLMTTRHLPSTNARRQVVPESSAMIDGFNVKCQ